MAASYSARPFEARVSPTGMRARAVNRRLRWAVVLMVACNALVWGGMIAVTLGVLDPNHVAARLGDQVARLIAAYGPR
jgi:hypothetical protein